MDGFFCVSAVCKLKQFRCVSKISQRLFFTGEINMSWQVEKEKYLALSGAEKRSNCVTLQDIPTWKDYAQKANLPAAIDVAHGTVINNGLNKSLAEKISVFAGDITHLAVDAIVNAANKSLLGGGGVDGSIHRGAGKLLKEECKTLGGCETGEAKITGAYKLPSKYVIHTVGPVGEKPGLLKNCYDNSLKLAMQNNLRSVAFPCISTGIYGYPNESAAHVAASTIRTHLEKNADHFDRIIFCLFLDIDKKIYDGILQSYFPLG
ncbi:uncharacterized protein LOC115878036 [Sitophilus oryzae]|uniref:Uncharacterized protein LOC115878036 n=1 Tax=Sitophilus oryzae TaxID=7048 RepID=A0A6J2XFX5_SITOR|nr:uncharacterized protein LOC115878036 [Sitophilus oryzae]